MNEANKWIEKAEKDLNAAVINLNEGLYDVSSFLSHQAAEKALKALYILKFKRLWKIHDLKQLAQKVDAPVEIIRICGELNPHYIATRYPVDFSYTKDVAEEALEFAKKVVEWVERILKRK